MGTGSENKSRIVEEQYLRNTCFTVAPVRQKICVLYVEKSASYLDLKCAITLENKITCVLN
jgi:hypothetical protein